MAVRTGDRDSAAGPINKPLSIDFPASPNSGFQGLHIEPGVRLARDQVPTRQARYMAWIYGKNWAPNRHQAS